MTRKNPKEIPIMMTISHSRGYHFNSLQRPIVCLTLLTIKVDGRWLCHNISQLILYFYELFLSKTLFSTFFERRFPGILPVEWILTLWGIFTWLGLHQLSVEDVAASILHRSQFPQWIYSLFFYSLPSSWSCGFIDGNIRLSSVRLTAFRDHRNCHFSATSFHYLAME